MSDSVVVTSRRCSVKARVLPSFQQLFSLTPSHTADYCRILASKNLKKKKRKRKKKDEIMTAIDRDLQLYWSHIALPRVCPCFIC